TASTLRLTCGTFSHASRNIPLTASKNCCPGMSRWNSANLHLALPNQISIILSRRPSAYAYANRMDSMANPDGSWDGPIGENIARAIEQGYSGNAEPYQGYFFKILKGQGPAAPLGHGLRREGVMMGG